MRFRFLNSVDLAGPSGTYQKVGVVTQRLVGESKDGDVLGHGGQGLVTQRLVGESKGQERGMAGLFGLVTQRLVGEC